MQDSLEIFEEPEGILAPIEFSTLPFVPKRMFYVTNVPKEEIRGKHAHYNTQQVLICVKGEILVQLKDAEKWTWHRLMPNDCVFVDSMVWDSQKFMTGDDILLSICSTNYDKNDYIEDFDFFIELSNKQLYKGGEGI